MSRNRSTTRRGFLQGVAIATGVTGVSQSATAQESGGKTITVELVNFKFKGATEPPLYITPGTTVKFVWKTGGHNIHVDSQPEGANWKGHEQIEDAGFTYTHTFETKGKYHFWCVPHKSLGMIGDIVVNESGQPPEDGEQAAPPSPTPTGSPTTTAKQQQTQKATTTGGGGGGTGKTTTVELGDFYFRPGTEEPLTIPPGTTVEFVWKTSGHNIHVDSQPQKANWEGHEPIEDAGFTYEHTFDVTGKYHYWCVPHKSLGMVGDIIIEEGASLPGSGGGGGGGGEDGSGGGGGGPPTVPDSAKTIGVATFVAMSATLGLAFALMKYGSEP